MSSLEAFYEHIDCAGATCRIGQPLIDALLSHSEAALAEGTSLELHPAEAPTGLRVQGVESNGLANRLGLREGDRILRVDELPLTTMAELLAAATERMLPTK